MTELTGREDGRETLTEMRNWGEARERQEGGSKGGDRREGEEKQGVRLE